MDEQFTSEVSNFLEKFDDPICKMKLNYNNNLALLKTKYRTIKEGKNTEEEVSVLIGVYGNFISLTEDNIFLCEVFYLMIGIILQKQEEIDRLQAIINNCDIIRYDIEKTLSELRELMENMNYKCDCSYKERRSLYDDELKIDNNYKDVKSAKTFNSKLPIKEGCVSFFSIFTFLKNIIRNNYFYLIILFISLFVHFFIPAIHNKEALSLNYDSSDAYKSSDNIYKYSCKILHTGEKKEVRLCEIVDY